MGGGKGAKGSSEARVYVGNLSWDVTWQDLKEHMQQAGEVEFADVMTEGSTGRSKGCGIVAYCTEEDAKKACEELTDSELKGRQIFVREDRGKGSKGEKGEKGEKGGNKGRDKGGGKGPVESTRIYVGNLSWDATSADLEDAFRACGEIVSANVMEDSEKGRSRGFGIVEFKTVEDAQAAVEQLQDTEILGRTIFVREDQAKGERGKGGKGYDNDRGKGKSYGDDRGKGWSYGGKGYDNDRGKGGKGFDRKGGGGKGRYGDEDGKGGDPLCKVFVSNLAFSVSWQDLKDHCRSVGEVGRVEIMTEGGMKGGRSKGCGIVEFGTPGEAKEAVERLHDSELSGRAILVREYRP